MKSQIIKEVNLKWTEINGMAKSANVNWKIYKFNEGLIKFCMKDILKALNILLSYRQIFW